MKRIFAALLASLLLTSFAKAQSLTDLNQQYQKDSPLELQKISNKQVIEASETGKTEAEEYLAEAKAKEEDEKKTQEERVYLNTDHQFFQELNIVLDEDELDKAYKAKLEAENLEKLKNTDSTVKSEIGTSAPSLITRKEGQTFDNKRSAILKKIAQNGQFVKACILQSKKAGIEFKGTAMTLAWEVDTSGKVLNTQVIATDVENKEIQSCILKALAEWNFGDIMKDRTKGSQIEYTYRFVSAPKDVSSAN